MSRHRSTGAYGHRIQRIGPDHYRLHWTVDRYYTNSRLRHPRGGKRDTDRAGALRFAKKHGVAGDVVAALLLTTPKDQP